MPEAVSTGAAAAIIVQDLHFSFGDQTLFESLSFTVPKGARIIIAGANGVGKSTLLRILAGRHMIPQDAVKILGKCSFHDLEGSQNASWVGGHLPLTLDIAVWELLKPDAKKLLTPHEKELLELLGVNTQWRMNRVSEGQRRRVQLFLALRRQTPVLLLDEVTANLDVTMRTELLQWLKGQSTGSATTILYATHIFDGLEHPSRGTWPTHLLWLGFGGQYRFHKMDELEAQLPIQGGLSGLCENWIRESQR